MLTEDLKENSHAAHQASEKKMIVALKKIESKEDYVRMLNWLYGFYAPIEARIREYLTGDVFPDMLKRSRAEYLLWDMQASGFDTLPPDTCTALPHSDSFARALGALYVLEGSTLGGRIIAGMLSRQLDSPALTFFNSYGAETGNMWQSFKDFLNRPRPAAQQEEIIETAIETFITFKNWIDKHELQPYAQV